MNPRPFARAAAVLCAVVGLMAAAAIAAPPASAATIRCSPTAYRFNVTEGSVPVVVGTLRIATNACVTSGKSGLSSSSGGMTWAASAMGGSTGWHWLGSTTSLLSRGSTTAQYRSSAGLQLCTGWQIVPLCGANEMMSIAFTDYGPTFVGHRSTPAIKCASSGCHLRFHYAGIG